MSNEQLLFPPGRIVYGSVDTARTTDFQGNPLTVKTGPNAGQPTQRFEFGVAIQKGAEQGWWLTSWGAVIFAAAQAGFPQGQAQQPNFSFKITDGDSQVPNQNNVMPCTKEGYPGHWVVSFSTALPISRHAIDPATGQPVTITQDGEIVPGYYVEVYGSVAPNGNVQNPGVFVNASMVCRVGYGERIISGPTAEQAGFGAAAAPQGATAAPPPGAAIIAPPGVPVTPQMAPAPAQVLQQPGMQPAAPGAPPGMTAAPGIQPQAAPVPGIQPQAAPVPPGMIPGQAAPQPVQVPGMQPQAAPVPGQPVAGTAPGPVPQPGMLHPQQ